MDNDEVDYANLLTGNWGCGKTFYCNNMLQECLNSFCKKGNKKYVVNISLFGRKSLGNIFTEITIKVIGMEKGYSLLDRIKVEEATSAVGEVTNKPWVSSVLSFLGQLVNKNLPDIIQGFDGFDFRKQVLIVFDDLERCEKDDLKYLIGRIQTDFIDNGYHVLFVANENEIRWEDFSKWKEKFIRTTVSFSKSLSKTVTQLLEKRHDGPIKSLYCSDKSRFLSLITTLPKIDNIRTWMFSFDVFDKIKTEAGVSDLNPYLHNLFLIIIISCYYNSVAKSLLTSEISILKEDKSAPTIRKAVWEDFHLYCEELPGFYGREWTLGSRLNSKEYIYVRMDSIVGLIQHGFLDVRLFKQEFETSFPWGDKYEIEYSKISDFMSLSEDELKKNISTVMEGVSLRKYRLNQYLNIAVAMDHLENNGYFDITGHVNYQTMIIEAVKSIDVSLLGFDSKYLKNRVDKLPDFIEPSIKGIIHAIDLLDEKKDAFFEFFQDLKTNGVFNTQSNIPEVFFEYVEKYKLEEEFLGLSGKALEAVYSFVNSFSNYDKCGAIYGNHVPSMRYLNNKIEKYLSSVSDMTKQILDLRYFNMLLNSAITRLELT